METAAPATGQSLPGHEAVAEKPAQRSRPLETANNITGQPLPDQEVVAKKTPHQSHLGADDAFPTGSAKTTQEDHGCTRTTSAGPPTQVEDTTGAMSQRAREDDALAQVKRATAAELPSKEHASTQAAAIATAADRPLGETARPEERPPKQRLAKKIVCPNPECDYSFAGPGREEEFFFHMMTRHVHTPPPAARSERWAPTQIHQIALNASVRGEAKNPTGGESEVSSNKRSPDISSRGRPAPTPPPAATPPLTPAQAQDTPPRPTPSQPSSQSSGLPLGEMHGNRA